MFDEWEEAAAQQVENHREMEEQERYAIAQLLRARGQDGLAAVVAGSGYRSDHVDNYGGGQYESVFEVPHDCFDHVDEQAHAVLEAAARAVVGEGHFAGMSVAVRRTPAPAGWDQDMLRDIVERNGHQGGQTNPAPPLKVLAIVAPLSPVDEGHPRDEPDDG